MEIFLPSHIIFGSYSYKKIALVLKKYGDRPLLVVGKSAFNRSFWGKDIITILKKSKIKYTLYSGVDSEPCFDSIKEGLRYLNRHNCDSVVGIGGGSVLDVSKTIAVLVGQKFKDLEEYLYGKNIKNSGLPFIAVPTTSGSGSEVSSSAVLKDSLRGEKRGVRDQKLIADVAIIDPVVTLTLGRDATLYSSLDALTHAVEAYVSIDADIASSVLAKEASRIIYKNLSRALVEPRNIIFRQRLSRASLFAALAFSSSGLGLAHALSHPIGAAYNLSHGLVNAVVIPYVVEFNYSVAKDRYQDLIFDKRYKSLYNLLKSWLRELGLPLSFKELGLEIDSKLKDKIVSATLSSGVLKYNPKRVKRKDVNYILERLWMR
ncbi:MAG: iron-containing alcohol dehydrogenase [Candidatus Kaelpia aquatica]|nr:iron-containing alcohol dehydrogenase [Candidatus Kaelpia aquatica]